jgi:hypothetical protein
MTLIGKMCSSSIRGGIRSITILRGFSYKRLNLVAMSHMLVMLLCLQLVKLPLMFQQGVLLDENDMCDRVPNSTLLRVVNMGTIVDSLTCVLRRDAWEHILVMNINPTVFGVTEEGKRMETDNFECTHDSLPSTSLQLDYPPVKLSALAPFAVRACTAAPVCLESTNIDTGGLSHVVETPSVTKAIAVWKAELQLDQDHDYIIDGLTNGFKIVDTESDLPIIDRRNYRSTSAGNKMKVEQRIKDEMID